MLGSIRRVRDTRAAARARRLDAVTFDDRAGEACDDRCRASALRDRTRTAALPGTF